MNENVVVNIEPVDRLACTLKEERSQVFSANNEDEDCVYRMFRQPYI